MLRRGFQCLLSTSRCALVVTLLVFNSVAAPRFAEAQTVTVRFEAQVTDATAFDRFGNRLPLSDYVPHPVAVGDTVVGFFVYDLAVTTDQVPTNPLFGEYSAAVCAGFSVGNLNIHVVTTALTDRNFVSIRDNVNFIGVPSDQFIMGVSQDKTTFLPPNAEIQYDLIDVGFFTNSTSSSVSPAILASDAMQQMPATAWENILFAWSERSGETQLLIEAIHAQPFQVTISAPGQPTACNLAPPPNTGTGGDVVVTPVVPQGTPQVSMTFEQVDEAGETSVQVSSQGPPPPAGFKLTNPPVYYEIQTSATFTGAVRICLGWQEGQIANEDNARVFHFENNQWVDVTDPASRDAVNNRVCATATSLSPFALMESKYPFIGFFHPIDGDGTFNVVKGGAGVPVKFGLGGDQGLTIFAAGYPRVQLVQCQSGAPMDVVEETVNAGSSSLSYDDVSSRYTYIWKTTNSWANTCRQLQLRLNDGETYTALFSFK